MVDDWRELIMGKSLENHGKYTRKTYHLVGGLEHFVHILGISSSQLFLTPSFFRGVGSTTN